MPTKLIHISDVHFRRGWAEEQGFVLKAFAEDVRDKLGSPENTYVIFTGDLLNEGSKHDLYPDFYLQIVEPLLAIGISRSRIIVIPGNHDIDRDYTQQNLTTLMGLQSRSISETAFNNSIYSDQKSLIGPKFTHFLEWQKTLSDFSLTTDNFGGAGFDLCDGVGIYCLNTALYSFGGLIDESGCKIDDEGHLPVETRGLHDWTQKNKHSFRILAMHHPASWLAPWSNNEIEILARKEFDLLLSGHTHEADAETHFDGTNSFLQCTSPPLFTRKAHVLGYSIIEIDDEHSNIQIKYRHWVRDRFVTGSALSGTDTGIVNFTTRYGHSISHVKGTYAATEAFLENEFKKSLKCYSSLPAIWVTPTLADYSEDSDEAITATTMSADVLISGPRDCVIKAPTQFGLSALGRYIALKTWMEKPGRLALFIESASLHNHETAIQEFIERALRERGLNSSNLSAIILDGAEAAHERMINNIKRKFPDVPIVMLFTLKDFEQINDPISKLIKFPCATYYLWSLDSNQIRDLVRQFLETKPELDVQHFFSHLVHDLENLNAHRTPITCLTLLTIYEQQGDFSPSNRVEMLSRFLFMLFASYKKTPDYSTIPDAKDSEYVLGSFCETLLKTQDQGFTQSHFLQSALAYCAERKIDVDCATLFSLLEKESIIVRRGDRFYFRYVHWIYFFCAHRMHHNDAFCNFILSESRYVNYPEIIEFYSGLDRRRDELISILTHDLRVANASYEARTGIDRDFDPYASAKWSPTAAQVGELRKDIAEQVNATNLPDEIKDQITDKAYDRALPYVQKLREFIRDSSLFELCQLLRGAARALRNSDHADPTKKAELLTEIMRTWSKLIQALVIFSPTLAKDGYAVFENLRYILEGFDDLEGDALYQQLLGAIPFNVVNYHEKDIASDRLSPLLADYLESSNNEMGRYIASALLTRRRPKNWNLHVNKYMHGLDKNSFYLYCQYSELRREFRLGFANHKQRERIQELLGLAVAKHELGKQSPAVGLIRQAGKKVASQIEREDRERKDQEKPE